MPSTVLTVTVVDANASTALKKMHLEERKVEDGAKKITKAYNGMELSVKRMYAETRTPAERHNERLKKLSEMLKAGKINQDLYGRSVKLSEQKMREAERAGQAAFGPKMLMSVKSLASMAGIGSIAGAVGVAMRSYDLWIQKTREIALETRKAGNEVIAFAALQEGGTKAKRVERAAALAAKYGIMDRGEAFNTVQAMQSVQGGDFEKGMKAAETVFQATKVGISVDKAREIEIYGANQGQKPGDYLRMAYVGGQKSGRTPETVVGGAEGLKFWDDKPLAFAASSVLSGNLKEQKLGTFLKRAGDALGPAGKVNEYFIKDAENALLEKWGLKTGATEAERKKFIAGLSSDKASQLEGARKSVPQTRIARLRELKKRGINTSAKLKFSGLEETREREALRDLIIGLDEVERIHKAILSEAKPGLLASQRKAVESELPTTALTRATESQAVKFSNEQAFGKQSAPALIEDIKQRARGTVYAQYGMRSYGPFPLVDEEGRADPGLLGWKDIWARDAAIYSKQVPTVDARGEEIRPNGHRWPVGKNQFVEYSVAAEQYRALSSARAGIDDSKLQTPEAREQVALIDAEIKSLKEQLESWSKFAEIQRETAAELRDAARSLNTATKNTSRPRPSPQVIQEHINAR